MKLVKLRFAGFAQPQIAGCQTTSGNCRFPPHSETCTGNSNSWLNNDLMLSLNLVTVKVSEIHSHCEGIKN